MSNQNKASPAHYEAGKIRLFLNAASVPKLSKGLDIMLEGGQHHYIRHVMRCHVGDEMFVFNGKDGEWRAAIRQLSKKTIVIELLEQTQIQQVLADIWLVFAPIKRARLDYLAQKATEMGVSVLFPMRTKFTQGGHYKRSRLAANAVEAAEQCGLVQVPEVKDIIDLDSLMSTWDLIAPSRNIIFCDERASIGDGLETLKKLKNQPCAIFIGPEGGFSEAEREMLLAHRATHCLSLGPRILRADTAVIAALTVCQMVMGDWQ